MSSNRLQTNAKNIFDALTVKSDSYKIPDYQRPYSWGKDEIDAIFDLIDTVREKPQDEDAFLGAIILKPEGNSYYEVVDGQQRISTFYMIMIIFFDKFYKFYKNNQEAIDLNYPNLLTEHIKTHAENLISTSRGNEDRLKIVPAMEDYKEFNDIIIDDYLKELYEDFDLGRGKPLSTAYFPKTPQFNTENKLPEVVTCIDDNLNFFLEDDYDDLKIDEERLDKNLDTFKNFIETLKSIEIIEVELADNHNPLEIFKSLNFAGIDLNDIDLLKAEFMALFPSDAIQDRVDFVENLWLPLLNKFRDGMTFKNPDFTSKAALKYTENFLWPFALTIDHTIKQGEAAKRIISNFKDNGFDSSSPKTVKSSIDKYIKSIIPFVEIYNIINTGLLPNDLLKIYNTNDGKLRKKLDKLRKQFSLKLTYLNLYSPQAGSFSYLFKLIEKGRLTNEVKELEEVNKSLHILESYYIRRHLMKDSKNPKNILDPYWNSNQNPWESSKLIDTLCKPSNKVLKFFEDKEIISNLSKQVVHNEFSMHSIKHVLTTYEKSLGKMTQEPTEVEHIMPRSKKNWPHIPDEDHNNYLNSLGNLTLVTGNDNKELSNKSWIDKKIFYVQNSKTAAPRVLSQINTWDVSEITKYKDKLLKFIISHWPYPVASSSSTASPVSIQLTNFKIIKLTDNQVKKGALDATQSLKEFFKVNNFHDFDSYEYDDEESENNRTIKSVIWVTGNSKVEEEISLYKTRNKGPRFWPKNLKGHAAAGNELILCFIDGNFYMTIAKQEHADALHKIVEES